VNLDLFINVFVEDKLNLCGCVPKEFVCVALK